MFMARWGYSEGTEREKAAMLYTTQGFMTGADLADHRYQTDTGATTIDMEAPPAWFTAEGRCPVCGVEIAIHDAFRVTDAGGTIFACLMPDTEWRSLPDDQPTY